MRIKARYEFTDEEKKNMAISVTEKECKVAELENEKKSTADAFKAQIDPLYDEIHYLSRCVKTGFEPRQYECRLEKDDARKMRVWRELETEKIILEEPFTPEDYQGNLPGISND